jgi:shikimate kinase
MKIFLIGLPGSGKSTFGKELARKLNLLFIDLDTEIEKACGKEVRTIFSEHGEIFFREKEQQILKEFSERDGEFVMATGGGAACFHSGIDIMNQAGLTIFLDVPVEVIDQRLNEEEKQNRPLLNINALDTVQSHLNKLLKQRIAFYRQAQITLAGKAIDVEHLLMNYQELLRK